MICTTYFLTFFSELIPPTGYHTFFIALSWFCDRAQYMNYF